MMSFSWKTKCIYSILIVDSLVVVVVIVSGDDDDDEEEDDLEFILRFSFKWLGKKILMAQKSLEGTYKERMHRNSL